MERSFDIAAAAAGLALLSPIVAAAAFCIKVQDGGPVFFKAKRVGKGGKMIEVYKFRTMVHEHAGQGPAITAKDDARITPVGRFLRRTKLDEIPQLINVIKGDMAIVGPRPEDPRYVALYSPEQRRVLSVRPGLTSEASIRFRREEELLTGPDWETTYRRRILPEKLAYDLAYIDQQSFRSDLKIMARTFIALFK